MPDQWVQKLLLLRCECLQRANGGEKRGKYSYSSIFIQEFESKLGWRPRGLFSQLRGAKALACPLCDTLPLPNALLQLIIVTARGTTCKSHQGPAGADATAPTLLFMDTSALGPNIIFKILTICHLQGCENPSKIALKMSRGRAGEAGTGWYQITDTLCSLRLWLLQEFIIN